jgi:hypothetical protein
MEDLLVFIIALFVSSIVYKAWRQQEIHVRFDLIIRRAQRPRLFWGVLIGYMLGAGVLWTLFLLSIR